MIDRKDQWDKISVTDQHDIFTATENYKAEIGEFSVDAHRFLRDKIWRDYLGERAADNGAPPKKPVNQKTFAEQKFDNTVQAGKDFIDGMQNK